LQRDSKGWKKRWKAIEDNLSPGFSFLFITFKFEFFLFQNILLVNIRLVGSLQKLKEPNYSIGFNREQVFSWDLISCNKWLTSLIQNLGKSPLSAVFFSTACLIVSNFLSLVAPLNTSSVVKPWRLPNKISVSNLYLIKKMI